MLKQRGVTLVESLVAIVVMALGVLGILGAQLRTLADTQTSVRRAQAIRLMDDLSERIRANPNGLSQLASYAIDASAVTTPPSTQDLAALQTLQNTCSTSACNGTQLATRDRTLWLATVRQTLPLGNAQVFVVGAETATNRRQLGVMISWRENERTTATALALPSSATGGVSCPAERSCHVQFIQPGARCMPYGSGATAQVICAD